MASYSNIRLTFENLNNYFKDNGIDNKVLVLDFSHFTKVEESVCNIKIHLYGFENPVLSYKKAMEEAATVATWKKFKEPIVRSIHNFDSHSWKYFNEENDSMYSQEPEYFSKALTENNFKPRDITSTLVNGPGNSILFLAKSVNNDEAQSIIYATLKNPVNLPEGMESFNFRSDEKRELPEETRNFLEKCFESLGELLMDEMVHSLYESWQKTELEKHEIEVREKERDLIFRKLFHSQKQHLALLSYLAKEIGEKESKEVAEIIEYTQKSLSEFLDINKYISESSFTPIKTDLLSDLRRLVHVFNIITSDKKILEEGIRLREFQYDPIVNASVSGNLFYGNYKDVSLAPIILPVGIPKLIFKEIIVNAIQHSKWDEPQVEINIFDKKDEICFIFTNKVTPEMVDKLNESVGNNNHGRDLIESLSKKIGWSVFYSGLKDEIKVSCTVYIKK